MYSHPLHQSPYQHHKHKRFSSSRCLQLLFWKQKCLEFLLNLSAFLVLLIIHYHPFFQLHVLRKRKQRGRRRLQKSGCQRVQQDEVLLASLQVMRRYYQEKVWQPALLRVVKGRLHRSFRQRLRLKLKVDSLKHKENRFHEYHRENG